MDYSDFDPTAPKVKRERYLLGYLGSVETLAHKGTSVVCQAVRRIVGDSSNHTPDSQSCILEVSDQGLRMVNRSKPPVSFLGIYKIDCEKIVYIIFFFFVNRKPKVRVTIIFTRWRTSRFARFIREIIDTSDSSRNIRPCRGSPVTYSLDRSPLVLSLKPLGMFFLYFLFKNWKVCF